MGEPKTPQREQTTAAKESLSLHNGEEWDQQFLLLSGKESIRLLRKPLLWIRPKVKAFPEVASQAKKPP